MFKLLHYEQVDILQALLYDDPVLQRLLECNQYALVTRLPNANAAQAQLTLSGQCRASTGGWPGFARPRHARLSRASERMPLVHAVAAQFDALSNGPARQQLAASLRLIAAPGRLA
jgi:hypothetical protein